ADALEDISEQSKQPIGLGPVAFLRARMGDGDGDPELPFQHIRAWAGDQAGRERDAEQQAVPYLHANRSFRTPRQSASRQALEHFPLGWNHPIRSNARRKIEVEHYSRAKRAGS